MPRLKCKGPIRKIHRASGVVDIYDDRDDGDTGQEDDEAVMEMAWPSCGKQQVDLACNAEQAGPIPVWGPGTERLY